MPARVQIRSLSHRRRIGHAIPYLLNDDFISALAAGSVNGTNAEPGPGTRVVVDTGNRLSIANGRLTITTGGGAGDPGIWLDTLTRLAGRFMIAEITKGATNTFGIVGWDSNQIGGARGGLLWGSGGATNIGTIMDGVGGPVVGNFAASTSYKVAIVDRGPGSGWYGFVKGGVFTDWELLWIGTGTDAGPYYPNIQMRGNDTSDYLRVPDALWLPTPLAYDTFTRANGVLGSTETIGPDAQAVTAKVWQSGGATWAIAANEVVNTPTEGAELLTNGDFANWTGDDPDSWTVGGESAPNREVSEVGTGQGYGGAGTGFCNIYTDDGTLIQLLQDNVTTAGLWYTLSINIDTVTAGSLKIQDGVGGTYARFTGAGAGQVTAFRAFGVRIVPMRWTNEVTDVTFDDVSVKALTLNTLFSSVETSTADVVAQVELDAVTAYTQAGMVLNLDDKDSPANFIIAYHDGTNAKLDKCVAGTYTSVISAAAAYSAGKNLIVVKDGTSYSLYYNDAQVGTTQTVSDAGIVDNTLHGVFSTYASNQLDNFQVFPRGTGSEYAKLEDF